MSSEKGVVVKIQYLDQIHRLPQIPKNYGQLIQNVESIFERKLPEFWALQYLDPDEDLMVIAGEDDFEDMMKYRATSIKIFVIDLKEPKMLKSFSGTPGGPMNYSSMIENSIVQKLNQTNISHKQEKHEEVKHTDSKKDLDFLKQKLKKYQKVLSDSASKSEEKQEASKKIEKVMGQALENEKKKLKKFLEKQKEKIERKNKNIEEMIKVAVKAQLDMMKIKSDIQEPPLKKGNSEPQKLLSSSSNDFNHMLMRFKDIFNKLSASKQKEVNETFENIPEQIFCLLEDKKYDDKKLKKSESDLSEFKFLLNEKTIYIPYCGDDNIHIKIGVMNPSFSKWPDKLFLKCLDGKLAQNEESLPILEPKSEGAVEISLKGPLKAGKQQTEWEIYRKTSEQQTPFGKFQLDLVLLDPKKKYTAAQILTAKTMMQILEEKEIEKFLDLINQNSSKDIDQLINLYLNSRKK